MSNIESAGVAQVLYTVEPDPDDGQSVIVTYWLQSGQKLGEMTVKRG